MKTTSILLILCGSLWWPAAVLRAQVPQIVSYQGRVAVGGVNFDGNGLFKFALVNAAGTTTHWSNDGTSVAGSEPVAAVSIAVTKGIYSVLLGDASLTNMTAIPHSVFTNSGVNLRVWFDDGVNGSQLLTPDQLLAAVGYAMMSATVHDAAITSAKIANGAVGTTKLAAGAVTATQLASGAVTSAKIAAGAVGATQIASGAVGFSDLAKPPQSGTVTGTGLSFDFGRAAFTVAFPQAFAAAPVVALSLATSITSFPEDVAAQVTAASATQFSGKVAFTSVPLTVDSAGNVGRWLSMAIVNGNPAICFIGSLNGLRYARATNASGTAWGAAVTIDSASNVGAYCSLAVVNGNPAISYFDDPNDDLKYVRANDANGTAWGAPVTVDSTNISGVGTSLVVVNGNPAIGYYHPINPVTGHLRYVRSTDASGAAWGAPVTVDSAGDTGEFPSMAVVDGNPAIGYYDRTNQDLRYVRATDASGTAWGTPLTLDSLGNVGRYPSLAVINGNPAISYHFNALSDLMYVRATDAAGTAWGTPLTVDSTIVGQVGEATSLAVVNGNPAISYYSQVDSSLKYVRATDADGTAWGPRLILDNVGSDGFPAANQTSLTVVNGSPAIGYYDVTNGDVKFIRQVDPPTGFDVNWIALPP